MTEPFNLNETTTIKVPRFLRRPIVITSVVTIAADKEPTFLNHKVWADA